MAAIELYSTPLYSDANLHIYYRLEGNSTDAKGNHNGTDTAITYGSSYGKFNQGASFNGSTSSIVLGTSNAIYPAGSWSISTWVYSADLANSKIVWGFPSTVNAAYPVFFVDQASNGFRVWAYDTDLNGYSISASASTSTWYLLTVTYNSSTKNFILYLNADNIGNATITGTLRSPSTSVNATIGSYNVGVWHNGYIDDWALFDGTILSSTEVSNLYNGTWSSISTINGLAKASVSKVNGLAIASVKTWNGLA